MSIYTSGLVQLAGILLKSFCSVQIAILLVSTTPQSDLLIGLRKLGIPRLLVVVTGLMWRYLSLSMDEAKRMIRARLSRSSAAKESHGKIGGSLVWRGRVTGMMAGSLLVRSLERSERVYAAMLARGYDGDLREPGTVKQTQDRIENPAADTPKDCKNNGAFPPYSDLDVEIDEVSYSYPDGRQALNNISLKIRAGEKIALLGMNGAGKSTLLWHLNGLLPNDHRAGSTGLVRVCGLDVREPMLKRVRAMVGLVFQNPDDQLFSPSVYEDIAYAPIYQGLTAELVKETVFASLRGVGMEDYSSRVPYHLSSGEKKRISIATVLASKPVVLALDEPTAGLDPNARRSLIDLLAGLPQSMLVATHDLSLAARMLPRSIILYKGMVVADGPTDSLLQDHRLLEQYGLV